MNHEPWQSIFETHKINAHNFNKSPYILTAEQIKVATAHYKTTNQREVSVLCKQDTREDRPNVFIEKGLFLLPIKNSPLSNFFSTGSSFIIFKLLLLMRTRYKYN